MLRRSWKEFQGVATRRIPDAIRCSITRCADISFDIETYRKLGEPEAMFLLYEESTRTIGLKPAHADAPNAVLVQIFDPRRPSGTRVVRSRPFFRENGINIDRTVRIPYPFIEDKTLILELRTAVTAKRGG